MKMMKKIALMLAVILTAGQTSVVAMAHGAHNGRHSKSYGTALVLCGTEGCHTTGVHQHNGKYYSGHAMGDGHDYHVVCAVEECTLTSVHLHDNVYYFGHFQGDGHDYHAVCTTAGCTEVTKHTHVSSTTSRGNGHHSSGHSHGGHH